LAVERSVKSFLTALGVDTRHPDLRGTPKRVALAWVDEFLDGYRMKPEEVLDESFPVEASASGELVVVSHLKFRSMCPHHLLPYSGTAHLAYAPTDRVVGFGRLSALLDCFAHRLVLQEELARNVATALTRILRTRAAACVVQAEQMCLRLRGPCQSRAVTHSEAYEGLLKTSPTLRRELWARIGGRP
jgi:GTP cyclohydrolase I